MKNTKREVIERLVPLNVAEIDFVRALAIRQRDHLQGETWPSRNLVERIISKLDRARNPPRRRTK